MLDGGAIFSSDAASSAGSRDRPRLDRDLTGSPRSTACTGRRTTTGSWSRRSRTPSGKRCAVCSTSSTCPPSRGSPVRRAVTSTAASSNRSLEPVFLTKTARYWSRNLDDADVPNEVPIDTWDGEQVLYDADNERLGLVTSTCTRSSASCASSVTSSFLRDARPRARSPAAGGSGRARPAIGDGSVCLRQVRIAQCLGLKSMCALYVGRWRGEGPSPLPKGYKSPEPVLNDAEGRWFVQQLAGITARGADDKKDLGISFKVMVYRPDFLRWMATIRSARQVPRQGIFEREGRSVMRKDRRHARTSDDLTGEPSPKPICDAPIKEKHWRSMTVGRSGLELKQARPGNLQMRVQAKDFAVLQTKVFLPDRGEATTSCWSRRGP